MVKFLDEHTQREIFRKRYLNTHEIYLTSIADVIATLYKGEGCHEDRCAEMVLRLLNASEIGIREDVDEEEPQFRNLGNSWHHEGSLTYPSESPDERLLFAAWKIVQCYYTVFSSSSI